MRGFPDLIIIDGGKGQLSMAKKAMEKANISKMKLSVYQKVKTVMMAMKLFIP